MILIFGGTTEGRLAAEVCEEAAQTFWYSTKSAQQSVVLHHGVRLTGAMDEGTIRQFCRDNGVRLIVDAAHPFAEQLHKTLACVGLPVVRLQRSVSMVDGLGCRVERCASFEEAMEQMRQHGVRRLLALSGANTIARLKPFWSECDTLFRILDRDESRGIAEASGLPSTHIIYYNKENRLPSEDEERGLMAELGCDAMLTKDSGDNGGFNAKVKAALSLGMKVFVVEPPALPDGFIVVTGRHGLRREIERLVPEFFPLRTGFTTGAWATAAATAAVEALVGGQEKAYATIPLPDSELVRMAINSVKVDADGRSAEACAVKDESDDPDVTKGCHIRVRVAYNECGEVRFLQGRGVGLVTLPGLGIHVGEPAVNPTPRSMIASQLERIAPGMGFDVTISVDEGEELAQRTFNPRVGVVGGISIIGTSGIVRPLSNEAFIESIRRELNVAKAIGCTAIGLVAGMKSEQMLMASTDVGNLRCVHYGNFVGESLKAACELGFDEVHVGIMMGKAVKLAEGHLDTHSHKVTMNKEFLVREALAAGCSLAAADAIQSATLARELWTALTPQDCACFVAHIQQLCLRHCRRVFPEGRLTVTVFE